jgi:5-methylcytosine-specific restriction endonuclease McrA
MSSIEQLRRTIAVSDKAFSVGELCDFIVANQLVFNTEYQRSEVWNTKKKQRLIDSILRKYDISKIFLRQRLDGVFECLDGQQRLRAIYEFLNNEYATSADITRELGFPRYYSIEPSLPDFLKSRIREFVITATLVHNVDDEITSDIFLRLQEGMPLNAPEKLNAIGGFMRRRVLELSRHHFFKDLGVKDTRFTHRYLAAQILAIELNNGQPMDVKYRNLEKLYRLYKEVDVPNQALDHITRTFSFLNDSLQQDKQVIRFRADVLSIYQLASTLKRDYAVTGRENQFHDFILNFLVQVGQAMESPTYDNPTPHFIYGTARSSSADSRTSLEQRTNVILAKFLEFAPDLQTKDPTRAFNYWQKLAIYYKDKGVCQLCKTPTPFDQGEADHIIRHADGGPTTVANGRWLCINCNRSISQIPTST